MMTLIDPDNAMTKKTTRILQQTQHEILYRKFKTDQKKKWYTQGRSAFLALSVKPVLLIMCTDAQNRKGVVLILMLRHVRHTKIVKNRSG